MAHYIDSGRRDRAKLALGGRPDSLSSGGFVEPTVFPAVDNVMTIAREEIFGPVIGLIPYDGGDKAARIANGTDFGMAR